MKDIKVILILLFTFSTIMPLLAQDYKSLEEFGRDTAAFLKYNFVEREEQYIGKTLDELVADLQLPIKDIWIYNSWRTFETIGLYLYICPDSTMRRHNRLTDDEILNSKYNPINSILIQWDRAVPDEVAVEKLDRLSENIEATLAYFSSFQLKIEEIALFDMPKEYYRRHYKKLKAKGVFPETLKKEILNYMSSVEDAEEKSDYVYYLWGDSIKENNYIFLRHALCYEDAKAYEYTI